MSCPPARLSPARKAAISLAIASAAESSTIRPFYKSPELKEVLLSCCLSHAEEEIILYMRLTVGPRIRNKKTRNTEIENPPLCRQTAEPPGCAERHGPEVSFWEVRSAIPMDGTPRQSVPSIVEPFG